MTEKDVSWVAVKDVCQEYGYTFGSAKNSIQKGTFPVPTYKNGAGHVIDRAVHEEHFARIRKAGLRAMKTTNG